MYSIIYSPKMKMLIVNLLLFLELCSKGYCQGPNNLEEKPNYYLEKENLIFLHSYMLTFTMVFVILIIRHFIRLYEFPVPYDLFSITIGFLWGVGTQYSPWMKAFSVSLIVDMEGIVYISLPAIIYSTAFLIDVHALMKSLSQIIIIAAPGKVNRIHKSRFVQYRTRPLNKLFLADDMLLNRDDVVSFLSSTMTGLIMREVIDSNGWKFEEGILFGSLMAAVYPMDVLHWLKTSSSSIVIKHVTILLSGETVVSSSFCHNVARTVQAYMAGWIIHWYQIVMGVIKLFGLGVPMSYAYGLFGASLMKLAYNDPVGLMLVTVAMCYTTYFFLRWTVNAGIIGTMVVGVVMGLERASLSSEIEKIITSLWKVISCIINGVLFINVGVLIPQLLGEGLYFQDYILVFITYLVANLSRFISFLVFSPILSRIGYGMSFQNMLICVWGGLKNPICLNMALDLYNNVYVDMGEKAQLFFLHTVSVYMLMLLINGTFVPVLMRALGLAEISLTRQINMNTCMKYIYEARARTVAILKMDRFLSDANWPLVMISTALKHPYKKQQQVSEKEDEEDEEDDEYFLGYKFTFCPDCQKNVPNEPTPKEVKDMTKEAKLRLLKLKKTAYSRLYENGMTSQEGIRIMHQAVEIAMDSEELVIELDGLFRLFTKEGIFYRFLRNRLQFFIRNREERWKPPRKHWRRWCYRLVNNPIFFFCMNLLVLINMGVLILGFIKEISAHDFLNHLVRNAIFFFFAVYFMEFLLKVFALSWIYVCRHGFCNYFKSCCNTIEFIILVCTFVSGMMRTFVLSSVSIPEFIYFDIILNVLLLCRISRLLTFFKLSACCTRFTPAMIKYLDAKVDRYRALAFELGKNYAAGEEEISENLHQIVDNDRIRESVKERIEKDRLAVTQKLGMAQKESPGVAATVKTKLAMRAVLYSMKEDVYELKISGWVDDVEYGKLMNSLAERYKFISTIKTIEPSPPKLIFREVPYMGDDEKLIDFLYTNVCTRKFDPGDVLCTEGETPDGIYIIITGMFMITYTPKPQVVEKLKEYGALPIIDYVFSLSYDTPLTDYIVPGNTIGEMSILTDRPYCGVITAETHSQVYVLSKTILKRAFEMDNDPVNGLECRIWKYLAFRKALIIMMNVPSYRSYTQEKIKYILERSFMPDLSNYKVFAVNDMMEDVILIEGIVVDFNTRDVYTGPCYLPRAVQKLVLPKSSFIDLKTTVDTKLLIIPAKDYDEYEIMLTGEETCELVNDDSSVCLRHKLKDSISSPNRASQISRQIKGITTGLRKKVTADDSNKSRLAFVGSKTSKTSKTSKHSKVTLVTPKP